MVPATSLDLPAGPSALTTVVPGRETFFSELDQEKDRGSLSQAWGGGRWDRGGRLGAKLARAEAGTAQLYKIRNSISSIGIVHLFGRYFEIHNWQSYPWFHS